MRIATRPGLLASGFILAAIITTIIVGDGLPMRPQPPQPVFAPPSADMPAHAKPGRSESSVEVRPAAGMPDPATTRYSSFDLVVLAGLRGGALYCLLFTLLHFGLRVIDNGRRWSYAAIGAVALTAALCGVTRWSVWPVLIERGVLSQYLLPMIIAGAIIGFLYQRKAGFEAEGDDSEALAQTLGADIHARPAPGSEPEAGDAVVRTAGADYFDGPLQVRTSLPISFVSALLASGVYTLLRMTMGGLGELAARLEEGTRPLADSIGLALSSQMGTLVVMVLAAPIPFTMVVLLGHLGLKAWGKSSYLAYIGVGAAAPVLLSLILGPVGLLYGVQAILPLALAMSLYRNLAGLEPKSVKEDVLLGDPRNLVGANHPRRQVGRLVKG